MSTKQPNSDDMEKLHPEQSTDPNTIEVDEDVQEQSNNKPFISDKSPAIFLASNESKEVTSNGPDKHDDDERNTYNSETIDTEKTLVRGELVPLVIDDVVQAPTQQLTSSSIDEAAKEYRSYTLYRDYTSPGRRRSRALRPLAPAMPRVRTSATHQRLRTQRHKKLLLRHVSRKRVGRIEDQRVANRFWAGTITIMAIMMIFFLSITGGAAYATYQFYTSTQYPAQILDLRNLMPGDNLKMYDRNGILIGQDTQEGLKTEEPLKQISPFLINATTDAEDKTFWTNQGIDVNRILESAIEDLRRNRVVAGGSTITQQLIKNLILTKDQNFQRKLEEVALVPDVNNHYSKFDVLEMYLNSNYYGEMTYGPEAAAQLYFGLNDQGDKSAASQLDLAQAAMLAGIPNSPTAYNPLIHPQAAFTRMQVVLTAMLNNGDITSTQMRDALNEAQKPDFFKISRSFANRAPHFYYYILDQLKEQYHMTDEQIARSDMRVHTTLDINIQDKIQKIAKEQIAALVGKHVTNAAEVLIDYHTGAIISMLGSIDYYNTTIGGQYNVTLAYRQPGSSFKPYVYVTAFADGISPGQGVADEPLSIYLPGEIFSPTNADGQFHGQMTIRCALQNSFNLPAVRTLEYVGIDKAMQTAKNMGITSYTGAPGYSLVLGGLGVRLLDHTSAYGTFPNGGVHIPHYGVEKIDFASTNHVDEHKADAGTRVISPQLAAMMTNVLSDNEARSHEFGKCSMLYLFSNSQYDCYSGRPGPIRPSASKTGTTNDFRDNLTLGYTADYVMGVWAGNNDNSPMNTILGITGAAPIWHLGMLAAEEGLPMRDLTYDAGLQKATVTYPDGVRSTDLFLPGKNPKNAASNPANQIFAPRGTGGLGVPWCPDFNYAWG